MSKFWKFLPKNAKNFDDFFLNYRGLSGAKACKSCRSRQELSNESLFLNLLFETDSYSNAYFLAKFGFDTADNEPCKVCRTTI